MYITILYDFEFGFWRIVFFFSCDIRLPWFFVECDVFFLCQCIWSNEYLSYLGTVMVSTIPQVDRGLLFVCLFSSRWCYSKRFVFFLPVVDVSLESLVPHDHLSCCPGDQCGGCLSCVWATWVSGHHHHGGGM